MLDVLDVLESLELLELLELLEVHEVEGFFDVLANVVDIHVLVLVATCTAEATSRFALGYNSIAEKLNRLVTKRNSTTWLHA